MKWPLLALQGVTGSAAAAEANDDDDNNDKKKAKCPTLPEVARQ